MNTFLPTRSGLLLHLGSCSLLADAGPVTADPPKRNPTPQEKLELWATNKRLNSLIEGRHCGRQKAVPRISFGNSNRSLRTPAPEMCLQRVQLAKTYQGQGAVAEARQQLRRTWINFGSYDADGPPIRSDRLPPGSVRPRAVESNCKRPIPPSGI